MLICSESLKAECDSPHVDCRRETEQTESDGNQSSSNRQNEGSEEGSEAGINNWKNGTNSAFIDDDKAAKEEEELHVEGGGITSSFDEVVPCVSCDKVFVDGNGNVCERNEQRLDKICDGGTEDGRDFDGRGPKDFKECFSSEMNDLQGWVISGKRKSAGPRGSAAPRSWIWNHILMIPLFLFPLKVVSRIISSRLHLWWEKVVA